MSTKLQNTEVEESLTQQVVDEESNIAPFNPLEGDLIDDEGGETDVSEDVSEETATQSDDIDSDVSEQGTDTEDSDGNGDDGGASDGDVEEGHEEAYEEDKEVSGLSETLGKLKSPKGRDYSKYSEEDAKFLKQMSNDAFEHFSKRTEEVAQLKKQIDETSTTGADHPDAYLLSDDYRDAYANLTKAQQEQQHWRSQLLKIRNGEKWQSIQGYDNDGRLVRNKDEYKPTQQAEIDVEMAMQEAAGRSRKFNSEMTNVSSTHQKSYKDSIKLFEREQDANFAGRTDDKVANEQLIIPDVGKTTIKTIKDSFTKALPKTFQKHPMAELASNLFVTLQLQAVHAASEKAAVKEAKRKEPNARTKSSKATANSEDTLSIPDWMNV